MVQVIITNPNSTKYHFCFNICTLRNPASAEVVSSGINAIRVITDEK